MPLNGQVRKQLVKLGQSPHECWEWLGFVSRATGYGKKQFHGRTVLAHRWIWEQLFGPIPNGSVINHKCSNRKCVNPYHLEVVSQAENCRHGNGCKLTPAQVAEIKSAKKCRKWGDAAKLARRFSVSSSLIHDIWNGRAWVEQ